MTVELPKDAKGREIPLDVEFLYNANGDSVKPYSFTFRRYDGFCWEMRLVGAPEDLVYETNSFYITPPDSWEKLEEDLGRVVENKDAFYSTACAYMNQFGATCNDCRLHGHNTSSCTEEMFKDIASRIRKLRGEGE